MPPLPSAPPEFLGKKPCSSHPSRLVHRVSSPDLPTPFDWPTTTSTWKVFAALCERQIAAGDLALVVVGETAGEAPTLSPAEQRRLMIRTAVDVARGRVRIIAGAVFDCNEPRHRTRAARGAAAPMP